MPPTTPSESASLHGRAAENLAFIRDTLRRSGSFSAVPGRGGVLMGVVGVAGAFVAAGQPDARGWLATWIATGAIGFVIALVSIALNARRLGMPVLAGPGRKFAYALAPSLFAGALLTVPLAGSGQVDLLPAVWLLLYGTAVTASASFSIRPLMLMGATYLTLGAAALLLPGYGDLLLGLGFGALNIGFGLWIWRYHGG